LRQLAALPEARAEVSRVAALLPGATLLVNGDATAARLQAMAHSGDLARFGLVHLATHARIDSWYPERSALVLAHGGMLSARDIATTWHLGADLVSLAACQTALGGVSSTEATFGLQESLFEAGARSLLVALWKMDDVATSRLMQRFYENLTGRYTDVRLGQAGVQMPKARALYEAKRWLRDATDAGAASHSRIRRIGPVGAPRRLGMSARSRALERLEWLEIPVALTTGATASLGLGRVLPRRRESLHMLPNYFTIWQ
jgi:CHAT domain-containing protein